MEEIRCERKVKAGRGVRPNVLDITMGQCIFCPHCNGVDVEPIEEMQSPLGTEGVWKCNECSGQFIIRRKTLLVWSEGMGPRASSPARGEGASGQFIDASGESSKTLGHERGLDYQVRMNLAIACYPQNMPVVSSSISWSSTSKSLFGSICQYGCHREFLSA